MALAISCSTILLVECRDLYRPMMRILNYSNPDVTFLGEQTGYIMANNASILRKNGCFVAGYTISRDFNIALVGSAILCHPLHPDQNYSVTIIPPTAELPGVGPYTVEWWQNTSGIFTYQSPDVYLGSGQQIQVSLPPSSPCPFFFLHVKVTSADGLVLTSTRQVVTDGCAGCSEMRGGRERFFSSVPTQMKASITPNPSSGYFKMEMFVAKQAQLGVSLYNARGELIRKLGSETLVPGEGTFERNIEDVASGFYWVSLVTEDQKTNLPLIILK